MRHNGISLRQPLAACVRQTCQLLRERDAMLSAHPHSYHHRRVSPKPKCSHLPAKAPQRAPSRDLYAEGEDENVDGRGPALARFRVHLRGRPPLRTKGQGGEEILRRENDARTCMCGLLAMQVMSTKRVPKPTSVVYARVGKGKYATRSRTRNCFQAAGPRCQVARLADAPPARNATVQGSCVSDTCLTCPAGGGSSVNRCGFDR